ncbi:MAG: T9SS type A sorting domain-containing protein [bacterium]|nr:T9SS type A sorting domain-containing protein [bacterium]
MRGRITIIMLFSVILLAITVGSGRTPEWGAPVAAIPDHLSGEPAHHNCRLWGAISSEIRSELIQDHLIYAPYSLKELSSTNRNGWGLVTFADEGAEPVINRSSLAAINDPEFDPTVIARAELFPEVCFAHVRNCSSGLCEIPNPHPFYRELNGKHWFLAHNGSILKSVLLDLIPTDYFTLHPPVNGDNPQDWIDSELYFMYVMQTVEEHGWDVKAGLGEVILKLRAFLPGEYHSLNFILSDGATLWAYREGADLFYTNAAGLDAGTTAIASRYPGHEQARWIRLENGELITATKEHPPLIEDISDYFDYSVIGETPAAPAGMLTCYPNPFNPRTTISCSLPAAGEITLSVHDANGLRHAVLAQGWRNGGTLTITWDGCNSLGEQLGSGVYLLRLRTETATASHKITMIR